MRWIYTLGIFAYVFVIRLAAVFGSIKAKKWVEGRKDLLSQYRILFMHEQPGSFIWFHVSSLGEFEQGRPVIESMRKSYPGKKILLTFFSPSGYEIRKNYQNAEYVMYLPFDCLRLMRKFVAVVDPCAVFFVKYDFWFNFITACKEKQIPVFFISAVFRQNHYFFQWWAGWFRKQLKKVSVFFVQNHESVKIAGENGINNVVFAGDTRLDRVVDIYNENRIFPEIEQFISGRKVMIAGSTWPADEKFIVPWIRDNVDLCLIIAPHDVSEIRLKEVESYFDEDVIRMSSLKNYNHSESRILLIDSVGVLAYLYRYAHAVYIGNGFGNGIHNTLEPVVYGKPVVFGPNYKKFVEAVKLISEGGVFSFSKQDEFEKYLEQLFTDEKFYNTARNACLKYVRDHCGATPRIITELSRLNQF